jgi:hypothetical protein
MRRPPPRTGATSIWYSLEVSAIAGSLPFIYTFRIESRNDEPLSVLLLATALASAKTMIYIGTFPNRVLAIDESTYQIVKRIEMKTDVPRNLVITNDKSKLIVATIKDAGVEVIDLSKGEVEDSFTLGDGSNRISIAGLAIDPTGTLIYTNITTSHKLIDRWEIGSPQLSVVNLKQHKIIRQVEIPASDRPQSGGGYRGGNYRVSPDGKYLYQFGVAKFQLNERNSNSHLSVLRRRAYQRSATRLTTRKLIWRPTSPLRWSPW